MLVLAPPPLKSPPNPPPPPPSPPNPAFPCPAVDILVPSAPANCMFPALLAAEDEPKPLKDGFEDKVGARGRPERLVSAEEPN